MRQKMRFGAALLVCLLLLPGGAAAADFTITITGPGGDAQYLQTAPPVTTNPTLPHTVVVTVGKSVTWTNANAANQRSHTATSDLKVRNAAGQLEFLFNTGSLDPGQSATVAFTADMYDRARTALGLNDGDDLPLGYICAIHPGTMGGHLLLVKPAEGRRSARSAPAARARGAAGRVERKDVRDLTPDEVDKYKEAFRRLRMRGNERPVWANGRITLPNAASVDRRGYSFQALIHTNNCPHRNWWFLPWHRVYLYYFEAMLRDAVSDYKPDVPLAIPYWNWTEQPDLPDLFTTEGSANPLFDARRFSLPLTDEDVGPGTITRVVDQASTFGLFGSGPVCSKGDIGVESLFEGGPHDTVHGSVGGVIDPSDPNPLPSSFGTMTAVATSAFDPIFWSHHANLDRLWDVWLSETGHTNQGYDDPCAPGETTTWGNLVFDEFIDTNGTALSRTVRDFLDSPEIKSVVYKPRGPAVAGGGASEPHARPQVPGAPAPTTRRVLELGNPLTLEVPLSGSARRALNTAREQPGEPVTFLLEGVSQPAGFPGLRVRAFLNNPNATAETPITDPSYLGYFSFFDISHGGGPKESNYAFDLTAAVRRLKVEFQPGHPATITLVMVPKQPRLGAERPVVPAAQSPKMAFQGGRIVLGK